MEEKSGIMVVTRSYDSRDLEAECQQGGKALSPRMSVRWRTDAMKKGEKGVVASSIIETLQ
jgi:hypothetical protein